MTMLTTKDRLQHVKEAIDLIQSFVNMQTKEDFLMDIKCQNAVLHQFLIIGEAIRHMDNSILEKYAYPWHIPRSFRNFIAHEYHNIKLENIYRAAQDLNKLYQIVDNMLTAEF